MESHSAAEVWNPRQEKLPCGPFLQEVGGTGSEQLAAPALLCRLSIPHLDALAPEVSGYLTFWSGVAAGSPAVLSASQGNRYLSPLSVVCKE